jgi:hypothetical protein
VIFGVAKMFDDEANFAAQNIAFQFAHTSQVELVDELHMDATLQALEFRGRSLFAGASHRR